MLSATTERCKAFRVHQVASGVRGAIESVPVAELGAGEVLIRAAWSSVNYKDALAATGRGRILRRFPVVPGVDVSGRVEISSDPRFHHGDPVLVTGYEFGVAQDGGYAEFARVPADWVVPLPEGMGLREAMALGTAGFTAALCVQRLEDNHQRPALGPIAVTGATGGVGAYAIDLLSAAGYAVHAISGKPEAAAFLTALGAAEVIDRRALDLGGAPLEKARFGGAVDNVGGELLGWLLRTIAPWGNVVSVGLAGGSELHGTVMPFILRGVSLLGVTASGCPGELRARIWQRLAGDLKPRHIDRIVTRTVELEGLPGVFEDMLAGRQTGRTLVRLAAD